MFLLPVVLLLLVGVGGLGTFFAWRSAGVRQAVLARATAALQQRTGLAVRAEDVIVRPLAGDLALIGVRAGMPGAVPALAIQRAQLTVELASLRRGTPVVRLLSLEGLKLDLSAPLPTLPAAPGDGPTPTLPPLVVERLVIQDAAISGGEVPEALRARLRSWRAEGIAVEGSFRDGTARLALQGGTIALDRPEVGEQRFALTARAEVRPGGPWRVERATLRGPGLEVAIAAQGDLAPGGQQQARFQLLASPDQLVPQLRLGGALEVEGELSAPAPRGTLRLQATGVSPAAARPLLPPELGESLALSGTQLDLTLTASFALAEDAPPRGEGEATALWRRGEEALLRAQALGSVGKGTAEVEIDAALLPAQPGRRRLAGRVSLDDLSAPLAARLDGLTLELEAPDLAQAVAELRRRWPGLVPTLPPQVPLRGGLELSARLDGAAANPGVQARATWRPGPGQLVEVSGQGRPASLTGAIEVQADALQLEPLAEGITGTVSARVHLSGTPESFVARFTVDGAALGAGEPVVDYLHLAGESNGREVRLDRLAALLGDRFAAGTLTASLSLPITQVTADLELRRPAPGVEEARVQLRLEDGVLDVAVPRADTVTGPAWVAASFPLGALRPLLGEALDQLPLRQQAGPVLLQLALPSLDTCALASLLPDLDRPERLTAGITAAAVLEPANPTAATGEVILSRLAVDGPQGALARAEEVRLALGGHRAALAPVAFTAVGTTLEVVGEATLAPHWRPTEDPPLAAVHSFSGQLRGTLEAALLQPYLAGAAASGPLRLDARLSGTPDSPRAGLTLDATAASFFWPTPYAARLEGLTADAGLTAAGDALFSASGTLNGGRLEVIGSRSADGRSEAQVELAGTRFRLDFGVLVQLDGQLVAELPAEGRSRIHGTMTVSRGRLDRPLSLRHELLPFLLAPSTTAGTAGGELDLIDLDIAVRTDDGVRVRNNLADLRLRWDDLFIRGTAWAPHLEGVVSVDPGGLVRALGQTLRLDRAIATFTGNPLTDPQLEVAVTSSLDDPSIGRGSAGALALLESDAGPSGAGLEAALATAAAGAVGGTIASSLSESLGGAARISLEPVLVFGEADPSARLTVARDVSPTVAFAVSLDLRNAERQTYLLDLHNLPRLPTLTAQIFTNDEGNTGATLQQALELGGTRRRQETPRPALRRLVLETPPELPRGRLRRTMGLARGDPLPEGVELDLELELEYQLRQLGYPDADVQVEARPVAGRRPRVDLHVAVHPGAPVSIHFTGEVPPAGARPLITSLYRAGVWEAQSLEEMRLAAVRVWRSLAYLEPQVTVTATPATPRHPRTVTIASTPGRRLDSLRQVHLVGVEDEVELHLLAAFAGTVELMELAAGLPEADRRLLATLATLGYPAGRVLGRTLDDSGERLTVTVDPGSRQRLAEVRIVGANPEDLPHLETLAGLRAGGPARRDEAAAGAVRIAEWYRACGHPDVRVRPELTPDPDDPLAMTATFEISPGSAFSVAAVELADSPRTSPATARRVAGVKAGEPLRLDLVREGRRRLLATGLFAGVTDEVVRDPSGAATVRYRLEERPPISLAYGVRWESSRGAAAVVDYLDRNLLGRALTFGARGLYDSTTRAGRLYLSAPDVLNTGVLSEAYLEVRRRITPGEEFLPELVEDSTRLTFQLSRPLGQHWLARTYGRWQRTHLFERTDFFPLDITLTLPYVGVGLAYDSRDDRVLARRGLLANLDLSGTGGALGADLTFGRLFAQVASFLPVGRLAGQSLTWASSLRLGLARTGGGQELIRSERFFAGGEFSVRGYPTESLGPQEDLGFTTRPLGGEALLVLNQELRLALPWDLTGLLFVDAGQVWESASGIDLGELSLATGVGLRAATPIGVLRLDAALPLDRRPTDPRYKLYVGFGSVF